MSDEQPPAPLRPGSSAEEFEEAPAVKIARLERVVSDQRRFARRMGRQLHARARREVKDAEDRARAVDRQLQQARHEADTQRARAEAAVAELEQVRASATWRAGAAVLAVPRRLRAVGRGSGGR